MLDPAKILAEKVLSGEIRDKKQMAKEKARLARKLHASEMPSDADILLQIPANKRKDYEWLKIKRTRSLSGVSVVAVMTPPHSCPHGKCTYCPGGSEISTPQSYTGREPAAMRGKQFEYDPEKQVKERIRALEAAGHPTDKIELIIMGGTFPARPEREIENFVLGCFNGLNDTRSDNILEAHELNEKAKHRCIGLTFETRPDQCSREQIMLMRRLGGTRVELGVQNPDNRVYKRVQRGHTVVDVARATEDLKNALFKVNYHLMTNLPGSDPEKDLQMFKKIFSDERFKPDMIKVYPTLLIKPEYGKTTLYEEHSRGEWIPYSEEETAEIIARATRFFPRWVRVMRVQRDIPSPLILAGPKHSNLRQLVDEKRKELGVKCKCIRCREIGLKSRDEMFEPDWDSVIIEETEYTASGGKEYFVSAEEKTHDALVGFVRLRLAVFWPEELRDCAGIRELHVYGQEARIGERKKGTGQHKGYGQQLLERAEDIAREKGFAKIAVISGVGVKQYYKQRGYAEKGNYLIKNLA